MRHFGRWRVLSLAALLVFFSMYTAVSIFIVHGVSTVERWQSDVTPASYDLPFHEIEFTPRSSTLVLRGWNISRPENRDTIIFVHGLGGDRSSADALGIGSVLWGNGFNLLLFDLRGHGRSDGRRISGGYFEQNDLLGAVDYLRGMREEGAGNIGVIGFSMGAATSILGAAQETDILGLVADASFADISDLISQEVARATSIPESVVPIFNPGIRITADLLYGIKLGETVPEDAVSKISYPILLIHGMNDTRILVEHSIRIHQAAPDGSELWKVDNVPHVAAFGTYPKEYTKRVVEYYEGRFRR
jgi:pimeloyl-ACP methyl ester carboxylesterase